ncbi:MAG: CHAP domain-containing protein [bacterium]
MTVDDFVAKYNGQPVDFDRAYGNQCWDLVAQYSHEVVGLQGGAWEVMPTGANGGAIEVFTIFKDPLGTYYTKIANSPDPNNLPVKGDIVIWNWGTYGHIGLCLGATQSSITIFEQNSPVGSYAHITANKQWAGCVGWIRPKVNVAPTPLAVPVITKPVTQGNNTMFNTLAEVSNAYIFLRGKAGTNEEMQAWIGKPIVSFFTVGLGEANAYRAERDNLRQQLVGVQQALSNELARPPKEVVKEVQKLVEVIKEVPAPIDEKVVIGNMLNRVIIILKNIFIKKG